VHVLRAAATLHSLVALFNRAYIPLARPLFLALRPFYAPIPQSSPTSTPSFSSSEPSSSADAPTARAAAAAASSSRESLLLRPDLMVKRGVKNGYCTVPNSYLLSMSALCFSFVILGRRPALGNRSLRRRLDSIGAREKRPCWRTKSTASSAYRGKKER
jgi:hypothetical protein